MTPQERAEKLADAHWGYIHALILEHGAGEKLAKVVGFHYRTAFAHGYKHATEDARETARTAFTPVQEKIDISDMPNGSVVYSPSTPVQEEVGNLDGLMPREYPFAFPPALKWMGKSETEYDEKLIEEVDEVVKANDDRDRMVELFDVIQTSETAIRDLAEKTGLDPAEAAGFMIGKNRIRGYYDTQG